MTSHRNLSLPNVRLEGGELKGENDETFTGYHSGRFVGGFGLW